MTALAVGLAASACRSPAPRAAVEPAPPPEPTPVISTERAAPPPAWLDAARSWPLVTATPIVSQHLGRTHLAEIRVSPAAEADYRALTPDSALPAESFFVEWLRDAESGRSGPILALERTGGGWRYWVLDARGTPERSGALEPCVGCHAGAPAPPVFGLPRLAQESTAGAPRSP